MNQKPWAYVRLAMMIALVVALVRPMPPWVSHRGSPKRPLRAKRLWSRRLPMWSSLI